jgi:serine protease Do
VASVARVLSGGSRPVADELVVAAELLRRSTVHVRVDRAGSGSGVIWEPNGLIVTNAHVARAPRVEIELSDGRTFPAEVTARDERRDLASLSVDSVDLPAAHIGDSDALRVGQLVSAVGNPLGLSGALTLGIIHAIAPAEGHGRQSWVQADVHLAPGNSGGPLADVTGAVIGINSMVAGGLGLAVPSSAVQHFLGTGGARPRLGIGMQHVVIPRDGQAVHGLLLLEVSPGAAADRAGLIVGDIVVGVNGTHLDGARQLLAALDSAGLPGTLVLDIVRGGLPCRVHVPLDRTSWIGAREAA